MLVESMWLQETVIGKGKFPPAGRKIHLLKIDKVMESNIQGTA